MINIGSIRWMCFLHCDLSLVVVAAIEWKGGLNYVDGTLHGESPQC